MSRTLYFNIDRDLEIYNLAMTKKFTYAELGELFGISRARAHQVKVKIQGMIADGLIKRDEVAS